MDENTYKSIIQEYEELLMLVEVVKKDIPQIKQLQEDVISTINNEKTQISKSVQEEKKHLGDILLSAISIVQKRKNTPLT